jgi:hypothetical protein
MDSEALIILFFLLPVAAIAAGVTIVLAGLRHRAKMLELVHRERVAMIERGIMPPELNPLLAEGQRRRDSGATRDRSFSVGIIVVGFGLALMTIIAIAGGQTTAGIGVGGAVAILGSAFIVRSLLRPCRRGCRRATTQCADPVAPPAATRVS